jgi:hypothetical protein
MQGASRRLSNFRKGVLQFVYRHRTGFLFVIVTATETDHRQSITTKQGVSVGLQVENLSQAGPGSTKIFNVINQAAVKLGDQGIAKVICGEGLCVGSPGAA